MEGQKAYTNFLQRWNGTSWVEETVTDQITPPLRTSSLAFQPDGTPWVAYFKNTTPNQVWVARKNGLDWETELIDEGNPTMAGEFVLRVSPADRPVLAYAIFDGPLARLRLASWQGSGWQTEEIDGLSAGSHLGMAISPYGTVGIPYRGVSLIKYATKQIFFPTP